MTKEKQIEEIAKRIHIATDLYYMECIKVATYLFEKDNCRIVDKDSVVLKIEELEDTCNKCHWVTDYKILKYHEEEAIKLYEQEVEQVRKETAKEFAKKLRNKYGKSCSEYYPELIELTSTELDELLKEYEVEE